MFTVDDVNFCDSLELAYVKYKCQSDLEYCLINTWVFVG